MTTWIAAVKAALVKQYGSQQGDALFNTYGNGFARSYQDNYTPDVALLDIARMQKLSDTHRIEIAFYETRDHTGSALHLRLFKWQAQIALSAIIPLFENFGLQIESDNPHWVTLQPDHKIYLNDFVLKSTHPFSFEHIKPLFQEAFSCTYFGSTENDAFNQLVIHAGLPIRHIVLIRAYACYLKQIQFRFSQHLIAMVLSKHATITQQLVMLFFAQHDPSQEKDRKKTVDALHETLLAALNNVVNLDEDRILRTYLQLILATKRTNYFQRDEKKEYKDYLSFKFKSSDVPDLPLPVPLFEIFIYAYHFEGIHLRNEKVARGGIRWSDRAEDFRTEVLGLMKAQKVKNAVIVPSGAKGGFVLKHDDGKEKTREQLQQIVIQRYQSFIKGLLDITDNIVNKKIIPPKDVVIHDDPDPYLVVAADKGTASFSDIANQLASDYHFWLGDAFASGGSMGYDHKKMGITARGAWESIKRHFRDLSIDISQQAITTVGIGDMSGDVFGNGLIYTKNTKLLAAFDHRHIFIDPEPDIEKAYQERVRLFSLPSSSWEDYNASLISKGGGVFKRSIKSIQITLQMSKALDIHESNLSPTELIQAILKAPVDLLYNGGIGTYVKASNESNADAGDKANDLTRINGSDIRAKVVGEGGNLGFTQLGRVECAAKGTRINTDFIDNAGGVDCSDHEVNLKILLNEEMQANQLSQKKRDQLLLSLTEEISSLVLQDNTDQAIVMGFSNFHAAHNISLHIDYIQTLENIGLLNRKVDELPDTKKLLDRKASGDRLTSPELAVLLAYTKIHLKQEILNTTLPDDPFLQTIQETAFPSSIRKKYQEAIKKHSLHREIFATQLSNHIVNHMGFTFIFRLQTETGETIENVIRAFTIASHIFDSKALMQSVLALDFKIDCKLQYDILFHLRNLISLATRWFLRNHYTHHDIQTCIDTFKEGVNTLMPWIPKLMGGYTRDYLAEITAEFLRTGLSKDLAERIGTYRAIYSALNIIDVSQKHDYDLIETAKIYFSAGEKLNLVWFRDQIAQDKREGHWHALARLTLRDDLDIAQRRLTLAILQSDRNNKKSHHEHIANWLSHHNTPLSRWNNVLSHLHANTSIDYSMFFIAVRELLDIIETTLHSITQKGARKKA